MGVNKQPIGGAYLIRIPSAEYVQRFHSHSWKLYDEWYSHS